MRVLDLFSGIGGFSLGLERAGMKTVAFCEIDPFCRKVLAKHWPEVPCYDDVRTLTASKLRADGIAVDVICGGFPCQDISVAGKGAGLAGERSGLWFKYARIIGELRPGYVIVENVAALLNRGLDRVLGDLAALGYDAEWHCIPASAVGAPHRRDRVWIVAYAVRERYGRSRNTEQAAYHPQWHPASPELTRSAKSGEIVTSSQGVANANRSDAQGIVAGCHDQIIRQEQVERQAGLCGEAGQDGIWSAEPNVGRVAHGIPQRVDRLKGLGNAVVPQIPEIIGRAILAAEQVAA